MISVVIGLLVVVPVAGTILYALFSGSNSRKSTKRITAFGEVYEGPLDDGDQRLA